MKLRCEIYFQAGTASQSASNGPAWLEDYNVANILLLLHFHPLIFMVVCHMLQIGYYKLQCGYYMLQM